MSVIPVLIVSPTCETIDKVTGLFPAFQVVPRKMELEPADEMLVAESLQVGFAHTLCGYAHTLCVHLQAPCVRCLLQRSCDLLCIQNPL